MTQPDILHGGKVPGYEIKHKDFLGHSVTGLCMLLWWPPVVMRLIRGAAVSRNVWINPLRNVNNRVAQSQLVHWYWVLRVAPIYGTSAPSWRGRMIQNIKDSSNRRRFLIRLLDVWVLFFSTRQLDHPNRSLSLICCVLIPCTQRCPHLRCLSFLLPTVFAFRYVSFAPNRMPLNGLVL